MGGKSKTCISTRSRSAAQDSVTRLCVTSVLPSCAPSRRIWVTVHGAAPNAVHHHSIIHEEAILQLRYSLPPTCQRRAAQMYSKPSAIGCPPRPISPSPRCAPNRSVLSRYKWTHGLWPIIGATKTWRDMRLPTLALSRRHTRSTCSPLCRPGGAAARWEFEYDPLSLLSFDGGFGLRLGNKAYTAQGVV